MLKQICEAAARGSYPPDDWTVQVVPAVGPRAYVAAFTGHHVVAADVGADEVLAQADPDDIAWPANTRFLHWLGDRVGAARVGHHDVVLSAMGTGRGTEVAELELPGSNPRVERSRRLRRDLRFLGDDDAMVILGRGVDDRLEVAIEISSGLRGVGTGRRLLAGALDAADEGEVVFGQVAPGNARSLRCFLAAGFTPIGLEVVLT